MNITLINNNLFYSFLCCGTLLLLLLDRIFGNESMSFRGSIKANWTIILMFCISAWYFMTFLILKLINIFKILNT